jgi:thiol-disulfide isomerase/thioredoxin
VNSRIFTAKDSLSLSLAKRDLTWLLEKRSESVYLEALLTSRYQEKKRQISLIDPYFFIAQQADAIPFMLSQKKGAIIVIDFWATWCKPCIAALPEFSKAAEQNTNPGIIFIAANTSDDREKWADFSKEHNISKSIFNIWLSPSESKKVYEAYYFDTLPHYVIIGKESTFLLKGARKFAEEVLPVLKNIK